MPFVSPNTVHETAGAIAMQLFDPDVDCTMYLATVAPPLEIGAVHDTTDEPSAFTERTTVADTPVGAVGGPLGVTAREEADAGPVPATFVAVTVKVYETPLVRPGTVHEFVAVVQVFDPGVDVTV